MQMLGGRRFLLPFDFLSLTTFRFMPVQNVLDVSSYGVVPETGAAALAQGVGQLTFLQRVTLQSSSNEQGGTCSERMLWYRGEWGAVQDCRASLRSRCMLMSPESALMQA